MPPCHVILDWDYDTFRFDERGNLDLYDDPQADEIVVSGWPSPGKKLTNARAVRNADGTYRLAGDS